MLTSILGKCTNKSRPVFVKQGPELHFITAGTCEVTAECSGTVHGAWQVRVGRMRTKACTCEHKGVPQWAALCQVCSCTAEKFNGGAASWYLGWRGHPFRRERLRELLPLL